MKIYGHIRQTALFLSLIAFACSQPEKKKIPGDKEVVHDTVSQYRSDTAAKPYINDFEAIDVDSIDAKRIVVMLKHSSETRLLADIDTVITVRAKSVFIRLYTRQAGPLFIEETHGVYQNVMVSVSDYGEHEINQVFTIGPFLGPRFKNGTDFRDHYEVEVQHGYRGEKTAKLAIYLNKVLIL